MRLVPRAGVEPERPLGPTDFKSRDEAMKTAGPMIHGNLPQFFGDNGEPWRARTSDPLIKSQLLYQLS